MDYLEKVLPESIFISKSFQEYMGHLNCVFLDIETTGINSEFNKVILAGVLIKQENTLVSKQLFAEQKEEEKPLLNSLSEILMKADLIINYNGSSFDIPFLNRRFQKNGIAFSISRYMSLDLYRIIKKYGYITFPDYKLKTIEKFLGINRTDTISGKESVALYNEYIKTQNSLLKEKILLHNFEDIYYLPKILEIIKKYDLHKIVFENPRYLRTQEGHQKTIILKNDIKKEHLLTRGLCFCKDKDHASFTYGYDYSFSSHTSEFTIDIPLNKNKGLLYLSLQDFDFTYEKRLTFAHIPSHILPVKEEDAIHYIEINWFINDLVAHILTGDRLQVTGKK